MTLWRADFEPELVAEVLDFFRTEERPVISFTDRTPDELDFLVAHETTGQPLFDEFVTANRAHADINPLWLDHLANGVYFHLCTLGTRAQMLDFQSMLRARFEGRVRTFVQRSPRYRGTMCEVLRADASKWSAVLHLADLWNVSAAEICAVGDDMNDIPMIAGAGLGVAMGHAPPEVQAAARLVTGSFDDDGVASLIHEFLLP
jgi:HAD superfamily hydrolase (TIGR01484 family)